MDEQTDLGSVTEMSFSSQVLSVIAGGIQQVLISNL